jgi:hypothetical protein
VIIYSSEVKKFNLFRMIFYKGFILVLLHIYLCEKEINYNHPAIVINGDQNQIMYVKLKRTHLENTCNVSSHFIPVLNISNYKLGKRAKLWGYVYKI